MKLYEDSFRPEGVARLNMLPPPNFELGKRTCLLLAVLLATTLHGLGASKVRSEKPTKVEEGFKPFAIISERNVFNANRELSLIHI